MSNAKITKTMRAALTFFATEGRDGKLPGAGKWETINALEERGLIAYRRQAEDGRYLSPQEGRYVTDTGKALLAL